MVNFTNYGTALCENAGQRLAEAFGAKGETSVLKENFGITFKEAGMTTTTGSGAYVDLLSSTLYSAAIEKIDKILDLVEINEDLKNQGGFGAMQLPRLQPTIAYEVAEGSVVSYFEEGVDSITVTCQKVAVGTSITWEILKRGMNDFARYVLKNAADAVTRKLASDILNGLAAGTSHAAVTGGIDFAAVIDAETLVNNASYANGVKYGFIANALVIASDSFGTFRKDPDVKNSIYYASAIPGQPINAAAMPLMFGNLEIIVTPFLTSAQSIVLERKRNILVKETDLETFEGQIPGRLYDREIVALMSYVMAVLYPASVAKITA